MFETASKIKLRFKTTSGMLSTEDLWDLPLTRHTGVSLDSIAKGLHKEIKDTEETSFVVKTTSKNAELELKFDIVKHVIKVRLEEKEANLKAKDTAAKKQEIRELIAEKEKAELLGKSKEELTKIYDDL